MENKQTAVEWLVDKLMKGEFINSTDELIEQAKEMEKEQIDKAYGVGYGDCYCFLTNGIMPEIDVLSYYESTYGK